MVCNLNGRYGTPVTMRVKVDNYNLKKNFQIQTHTNAPLAEVRRQIATYIDLDLTRNRLQLPINSHSTLKRRGSTRLSELGVTGDIQVRKPLSFRPSRFFSLCIYWDLLPMC